MPPFSVYGLTRSDWNACFAGWGHAPPLAARLWRHLYREGIADWSRVDDLPPRLRKRLSENVVWPSLRIINRTDSADGQTSKFLVELADGQQVETVLMHCRGRITACLSSQAGCPLGCVFCATGQMGFARNLTASETVGQVMIVNRALRLTTLPASLAVRNVVFMGMGEPLLNYDNVLTAAEVLGDSGGLAIAGKRLTLSTVGVIPGIVRLADERRPCSLAVSLHSATQDERAALVPAARTWPLADLMEACRYYAQRLGRRIFFEWTLIPGVNDSAEQARALAGLVRGLPAQINLIPLNPTAGYDAAPGNSESLFRFQLLLRELGLPVTIRRRRGINIAAGCGQLAVAAIV